MPQGQRPLQNPAKTGSKDTTLTSGNALRWKAMEIALRIQPDTMEVAQASHPAGCPGQRIYDRLRIENHLAESSSKESTTNHWSRRDSSQ